MRLPPIVMLFAVVIGGSGCASPPSGPPKLTIWGTMRAVLRDGQDQARVELAGLERNGAIGVGALAGLAGEVTIVDGEILVAEVRGDRCHVGPAEPDAAAALLVRAEVERWSETELPDCSNGAELDAAIGAVAARLGLDRRRPIPVRIRGRARHVAYHVIAGACPVANPTGPPPWRFAGALDAVELVGFYVEGAAGRWTHHTSSSHLHVVAPGRTGHLDDIDLTDAVLLLPAGLIGPRTR